MERIAKEGMLRRKIMNNGMHQPNLESRTAATSIGPLIPNIISRNWNEPPMSKANWMISNAIFVSQLTATVKRQRVTTIKSVRNRLLLNALLAEALMSPISN